MYAVEVDDEARKRAVEELAGLLVTRWSMFAGIVIVVAIGFVAGVAGVPVGVSTKLIVSGLFALSSLGALVVSRRAFRADRIRGIRVMYHQPAAVAHVVTVERGGGAGGGGAFLLVAGGKGALVAPPMRVARSDDLGRVRTLAEQGCPRTRVHELVDTLGVRSLATLARKAIADRG